MGEIQKTFRSFSDRTQRISDVSSENFPDKTQSDSSQLTKGLPGLVYGTSREKKSRKHFKQLQRTFTASSASSQGKSHGHGKPRGLAEHIQRSFRISPEGVKSKFGELSA